MASLKISCHTPARPRTLLHSKQDTDIDAALRDCLLLVRHNPKVNDAHRFDYEAPAKPIRSRVSETSIKQVMWNLLQNSINAMPDGGDIRVRVNETAAGRVLMEFQDNGPGFYAG